MWSKTKLKEILSPLSGLIIIKNNLIRNLQKQVMRSSEENERPYGETQQFVQRIPKNARPIKNSRAFKETPQIYERTGHWTEKQNAKYYAFLEKFQDKFSQKQSRRQHKVFKTLAQFIKTRNANQCRSHHHKMQKDYKSIEETLKSLLKRRPNLESRTARYIQQLNKLQSCFFTEANEKRNQEFQNQKAKGLKNHRLNQSSQDSAFVQESVGKKNNIANMKTGVGYEDEEAPVYYNEAHLQYPAPTLNQNFFSSNQHQPYFFENMYPQAYQNYNEYNPLNFNMHQEQMYKPRLTPRQEKAIEAHECFTRWITKLSTLMSKTQCEFGTYTTLPQNNKNINYTPYF